MEGKKNILMILSDDHGYWGMGCAGNTEVHTPNLDKIAKEGIRFENFFCASPVCSPARASIFTGKIPSQHGIHDWIGKGHINESEISNELREKIYDEKSEDIYIWSKVQMKGDVAIEYLKDQKLFTEHLNESGYECAMIGKWHLGNSGKPQGGFSYWKTLALGGDNYYYATILEDNQFVMKEGVHITDYITKEAIHYIEEKRDNKKPFYLSIHYTAPHSPWEKEQHPEEIYRMYENCPCKDVPFEALHPWSNSKMKTEEEHRVYHQMAVRGYYSAITAMDRGIGEILEVLKEQGLLENTIILFTGDNGMNMGHHGIYGKGNGTFPLNLYDTSVKVPMLIRMPNEKEPGRVLTCLLSHYDLAPTLMDVVGLEENIIGENLPGKSFKNILEGEDEETKDEVVIMDEYGPNRMIRTQEWKYIHRYPYGPHELYHLSTDPEEVNNLINKKEYEIVKYELRNKLNLWYSKYVDPNKDGKGEAVTGNGQINLVGIKSNGKPSFNG